MLWYKWGPPPRCRGQLKDGIMRKWDFRIDVDAVLRCQGADPQAIRDRNPRLVETTDRAIVEGSTLLNPLVYQRRLIVHEFAHRRLHLNGGGNVSGPLIAQHMAAASEIVAVLCTIGSELESHASKVFSQDPVLGLALDGVGSAAIEVLAHTVCNDIEKQARKAGQQTTIPLSPGMVGWPVEEGQDQLFALWSGEAIDINLTDSFMMTPAKSLSMIVGLGPNVFQDGKPCDYCSMGETCRYQDHDD